MVLAAAGEAELRELGRQLAEAGIPHTLIAEPDPPYYGQATALGLEPTRDRRAIRRVLGRLPLLR